MDRRTKARQRSPRLRLWLRLFVLSMVIPPLLMSGAWLLPGAIAVLNTGTCPPAPPDIPAYPCSLGQYLVRMTFGAWALMGHLAIWMSWVVGNFVLWAVGLFSMGVYRSWRSH